jgi:O-antigen/teichoic acid export membrane protein
MAIAVLSKEFIFFLYGSKYQEAPLYLMLNMLIFLSAGLGSVTINSLFNSQGDTKISFIMSFINIILSIPLASIMIPLYNVQGLIASNIISLLISMSYGLYKMKKMYNIQIEWFSSFKIVTSSLLSSLLVYSFLNVTPVLNPILSLALGWGIYLISFLFFAPLVGAIELEDLNILEGLIVELHLIYPLLKLFLKIERKIVNARNGALNSQAQIRMTTHGD